jgi:hypothetical protein
MAAVLCARLLLLLLVVLLVLLLWLVEEGPAVGAGRMCKDLMLPLRERALRAALHC